MAISEQLNKVLIRAYNCFKDDPDHPLPLELIKMYLEDEGIDLDGEDSHDVGD